MFYLLKHSAGRFALCAVSIVVAAASCGPRAPQHSQRTRPVAAATSQDGRSPSAIEEAVALEIDFGNGRIETASVVWREGLTALDVLTEARTGKPLKIERRGQGEATLVEAIDGVHNGTDKSQRNWLVKVNGKLSRESAAVTPVRPGDRVLWEYAAWE